MSLWVRFWDWVWSHWEDHSSDPDIPSEHKCGRYYRHEEHAGHEFALGDDPGWCPGWWTHPGA